MKTEHTPGPWKFVRESKSLNWLDLMLTTEDDAKIIGWIYNDHEADARLIVAAPEMREALKEILTIPEVQYQRSYKDWIAIIEKATDKTWAEIKEAGE